jgi:uncharacterized Zn-finger protein
MNLNNSRHTSSEQSNPAYPVQPHWSRSGQRVPYSSSNGSYYPPAQASPPVSPTMSTSSYASSYYPASNAPPSGMAAQQGFRSPTTHHSSYPNPVTSSQPSHNVSPSMPYPPQPGAASDPRAGYSHHRSGSLPQQSYAPSSMSSPAYRGHDSGHNSLMVQSMNQVQYPASPQRPFACDMCALSFNRQHDLKRHRETHSGEKPFLCNGGCGKTFTRKDALKRHQVRPTSFQSSPA